jgi:MFS family permease
LDIRGDKSSSAENMTGQMDKNAPVPPSSDGDSSAARRPTGVRSVATVVAAQTLSSAPVFLFGGLAVEIRRDMPLDQSTIGFLVAGFFAAGTLGSLLAGRFSDRGAGWTAIRASMVVVMAAHLGLAAFASTPTALAGVLLLAGFANGVVQPFLTLAVARVVSSRNQGLAFGIKQSAVPIATISAGLSLPLIALTLGWQWVFALFALLTFAMLFAMPSGTSAPPATADRGPRPPGVIALALACGFAAAGANSMAAFLTVTVVDRGMSAAFAGALVAAGGISAIVTRVGFGRLIGDGLVAPLTALVVIFAGGSVGYAAIAMGTTPAVMAAGAVLGFGLGWGWPGLTVLVSVRLGGAASAGATSAATQAGVFLGAVFGPLAFGWIAEHHSLGLAWTTNAAAALAAAAVAARVLALHRGRGRPTDVTASRARC